MDYKNYILCGLIAFGMIVTAISKPTPDDRTTGDEETLQNDQNDDYDYGEPSMSADQAKSTASSPKSTMLPYFDNKSVQRIVRRGGNITLNCPVRNLADSNVILWFKEENTIINNLNVLDNAYELVKQNFSIIIRNATESFAGNYYCEIAPQKIRMHTALIVMNDTVTVPAAPTPPQIKEADAGSTATANFPPTSISALILVSTLLSSLLSHRKCFQSLLTF